MTLIPRSRQALTRRTLAAALLLAGAALLGGCSATSNYIADRMPTAAGGLPEGTPQRPETPAAYPAVHDLPPPRTDTMLTPDEQKKLEDELIAARARTAGAADPKAAGNAAKPKATGSAANPKTSGSAANPKAATGSAANPKAATGSAANAEPAGSAPKP